MGVTTQSSTLPWAITTSSPVSLPLYLLLAISSRVYLLFPVPAAMNLRPPSVAVSTHTLALNAVSFQSPAMPNARMSLCTQSVHSFFFPPRRSALHPQGFRTSLFWQPPATHSDERPRPQKSSLAQRCLNAFAPGYLKGTVVRGHPMVWSLALCRDDAKQNPVMYGA